MTDSDAVVAVMAGKTDSIGQSWPTARAQVMHCASVSILNRPELTAADASAAERYEKVFAKPRGHGLRAG